MRAEIKSSVVLLWEVWTLTDQLAEEKGKERGRISKQKHYSIKTSPLDLQPSGCQMHGCFAESLRLALKPLALPPSAGTSRRSVLI